MATHTGIKVWSARNPNLRKIWSAVWLSKTNFFATNARFTCEAGTMQEKGGRFTSFFFMIASQCKRVDSNHQSNDAIARSTIWPISCYAYRHRPLKFDYRPATSHFWWIQNFRLRAMLMDGIEPSQTGNYPECSCTGCLMVVEPFWTTFLSVPSA